MYQIYQNLSKVESMHKHLTISIKRYISTSKKQCITINSQNMTVSRFYKKWQFNKKKTCNIG